MNRLRLAPHLARWIDQRVGGAGFAKKALDKVFPDHWSFLLVEIALYCFMVLIGTGVFLTFFFDASSANVVYHGSYAGTHHRTRSGPLRAVLRAPHPHHSGDHHASRGDPHMVILIRHKHTHFPGPGRRDDNVVGERLWPTYAAKATALLFITAGVVFLLGGLAQSNPVWLFGPFRVGDVSAASQPDWYMGWLDGALRIMPAWEIRLFGYEIPNPFFPAVLMPGLLFGGPYAVPFIEARFTNDRGEHHVLDRPRDRPLRTAIAVASLAFYLVLLGSALGLRAQHVVRPLRQHRHLAVPHRIARAPADERVRCVQPVPGTAVLRAPPDAGSPTVVHTARP